MYLIPSKDDEGEYTDEFKLSLIRSLSDIKNRRIFPMEEVKKQLGIL